MLAILEFIYSSIWIWSGTVILILSMGISVAISRGH